MNWLTPYLQAEVHETDMVLDLCCGHGLTTDTLRCALYVGVDIDRAELDRYAEIVGRPPSLFIQADVSTLPTRWFTCNFGVALCIDGVEHLDKADALALVDKMGIWAAKVIIVTPDRFFDNRVNDLSGEPFETNYNRHKCLLTEEEFASLGYITKLRQPEVLGHNCMVYMRQK